MEKLLQRCGALVLAACACTAWAKPVPGQTVSDQVELVSGDVFALPGGRWEIVASTPFSDGYGSAFDALVLKNSDSEAAIPLLVIRQMVTPIRVKNTNCDDPSEGMVPNMRHGTTSATMVTKCSRMFNLASYDDWLHSRYATDVLWWKALSEKFPDLGPLGAEPMVMAEYQVTHFNAKILQFEAFIRTAQLGISPRTIREESRRGLDNPIHQALREWSALAIDAADAAVFDAKPRGFSTLDAVYVQHGLDGASPSPSARSTPDRDAQPAYSGRWPDDPTQPGAQAKLAWKYRYGKGVERDVAHAYELFRRAAEKNEPSGVLGLAWAYLEGVEGVAIDEARGFSLVQKAANLGDRYALADLGHLYQEAIGTAKDDAAAIRYYRLAAEQDVPWGAMYLARSYRDRRGVPQDEAEAAYWYQKAASWFDKAKEAKADRARAELAALPEDSRSAAAARLANESGLVLTKPMAAAATPALPSAQPKPAVVAASSPPKALGASPTYANRKALVIGNDQYQNVGKLLNARADAKALSVELTQLGYQVSLLLDQNERQMKQAVRDFKAKVEGGDEVLFFYAGHGVQLGNANYLLPVDIKGENEEQVKDEAIQLQRVLDDMQERRAKFTLAVVDACRDNPFKSSGRALGGRGLAPTTAATGQMIIFSAGSGQQALDKLGGNDTNPNSVFTRTFIKEMDKPGVTVDRVLRNVRNQVVDLAKSVGHEQVPALYDQVVGDFYFKQ